MSNNNNFKPTKKKRAKFRLDMVILSCVVAFAACFVIYLKVGTLGSPTEKAKDAVNQSSHASNSGGGSSENNSQSNGSNDSTASTAIVNPAPVSTPAGMEYFNDCAFVGDSLTVGMASYNLIPQNRVIASVGMNISKIDSEKIHTTDGDLTAIDALIKLKPKNIYIMLGSNGIGWLSDEAMIKKYSAFVDSIKNALPQSKIIILSIPPVSVNRETSAEGPILNSRIDSYNSELLKFANEKQLCFVDINTGLKNNQGKLDAEKAQKDGMHFKKETYDLMFKYLLSHIPN